MVLLTRALSWAPLFSFLALLPALVPTCSAEQDGALPSTITLEQAEELLLSRSIPMLVARHQIDAAEAARRVAALRLNPTLTLNAEQLPMYSGVPRAFPNFYRTNSDAAANPTYGFELGQLFERGGKRQLRTEQAEYQLRATKAESLDALREQLFELRQAFTEALLAKANLQLAEEANQQYAETERLMEVRLRGGEIAGVDLDRVRAARLPFLQAVLDARLSQGQATRRVLAVLGATVGRMGGRTPEVQGELDRSIELPSLDELRDMAAKERPDLKAAQAQARAAERGTRLAEAQRKRDVQGSFLAQRTGQDYAIGAGVTIPLFVYNNQRDGIAQSLAGERAAVAQAKLVTLQVESDVERAYEALEQARAALDLYSKEALERSRSVRSIITYSYQRGEADLLEVLDAQRSANQILTGYNQARASLMHAYWRLQFAVGRSF